VNVVCISGTIGKAGPAMSYTKNMKAQTTFEPVVTNEDNPEFYTKESVLIVGSAAEAALERLEAGDEVELTGKLQRGQVVCFRVHVRQSAMATAGVTEHEHTPEYQSDAGNVASHGEAPEPVREPKVRKRPVPKHLQKPWVPTGLVSSEN